MRRPRKKPGTVDETARAMAESWFRVEKDSPRSSKGKREDSREELARERKQWASFVFTFEEAQHEAEIQSPGWTCCPVCGRNWVPHRRSDEADGFGALCQFDAVRALNRLIVRCHATHGSSSNAAYMRAYVHLLGNLKTLGPERLAERALVPPVLLAQPQLKTFLDAATAAAATCNWKREWEPVAEAIPLVEKLLPLLRRIEDGWAFGSKDRSLPGTRPDPAGGRPPKLLLAEVEGYLRSGGVRPTDIARLDLDGEIESNGALRGRLTGLDGLTEPLDKPMDWAEIVKRAEGRVAQRYKALQAAQQNAEAEFLKWMGAAPGSP